MSRPPKQHDEQTLRKQMKDAETAIAALDRQMQNLHGEYHIVRQYAKLQAQREELQSQIDYHRWLIRMQPTY